MITSKSPRTVVMVAMVALAAGKDAFWDYSNVFSPHKFTQPQLFACLVIARLEAGKTNRKERVVRRNVLRVICIAVPVFLCAMATGRLIAKYSIGTMADKSMVTICADAVASSEDKSDVIGEAGEARVFGVRMGVNTSLAVSLVIRGDPQVRGTEVTVHH